MDAITERRKRVVITADIPFAFLGDYQRAAVEFIQEMMEKFDEEHRHCLIHLTIMDTPEEEE